ncbi:MAG: low molecular weight protein-tyrosine-phosphatase [Alphaproteobacteria bacterium]
MTNVLFVCTGNICRSPTAEGVMRYLAARRGVAVRAASAGTHDYHAGEGADSRAVDAAARRGIDLSRHVARKVRPADFDEFDWIVAMDRGHYRQLDGMRPGGARARLSLLMEHVSGHEIADVPDPYFGGRKGFERVLDLIEAGVGGLLDSIGTSSGGPERAPG